MPWIQLNEFGINVNFYMPYKSILQARNLGDSGFRKMLWKNSEFIWP